MKKSLLSINSLVAIPISTFFLIAPTSCSTLTSSFALHQYDNWNERYITDYATRNGKSNTSTVYIPNKFQQLKTSYMKSVWTATVENMNWFWDSKDNLSSITKTQFQNEVAKIIKVHTDYHLNTMIFQVRPMMDAFYRSQLNPASYYLTGEQGSLLQWMIDENFDPLNYIIEKAHDAGLKFQAWFNPYRVSMSTDAMKLLDYLPKGSFINTLVANGKLSNGSNGLQPNWLWQPSMRDPTKTNIEYNPRLLIKFAGGLYLNPGEPDVVNYVNDSVMEVVQKYDIDGVHFDDYFYRTNDLTYEYSRDSNGKIIVDPGTGNWEYPSGDTPTHNTLFKNFLDDTGHVLDWESYQVYVKTHGIDPVSIDQWRRDNCTELVGTIRNSINLYNQNIRQSSKPFVEFGISPGGQWGSKWNWLTPTGSDTPTTSMSTYMEYVDTKKWVEDNLLDYICPQLYWNIQYSSGPFVELSSWWNDVITKSHSKTKLYLGHACYRIYEDYSFGTNRYANQFSSIGNPDEIINQIKYASTLQNYYGSIFFSLNDLDISISTRRSIYDNTRAHRVAMMAMAIVKEEFLNIY